MMEGGSRGLEGQEGVGGVEGSGGGGDGGTGQASKRQRVDSGAGTGAAAPDGLAQMKQLGGIKLQDVMASLFKPGAQGAPTALTGGAGS
jgi:hypothetical protein